MVTISNDSVKAYVKSIVMECDDRWTPVYWLVSIGSKVALQSIFASFVNKNYVVVRFDREDWKKLPQGGLERSVGVPHNGKMHANYKKLQSGHCVMVMYSSLVRTEGADREWGWGVLLCREDEDPKDALFQYVKSQVRVPLHESWKDWVWKLLRQEEYEIRDLIGFGLKGFFINLENCERKIEKNISLAIKKGKLKVERR